MKRILFVWMVILSLFIGPYISPAADTSMDNLTDGSASVATSWYAIGYNSTTAYRFTLSSLLGLKIGTLTNTNFCTTDGTKIDCTTSAIPYTFLPTNSDSSAGIVASGSGQSNLVWKTDASGVPSWREDSTGGTPSFDAVTSGTNVTATMTLGTGSSLTYADSGQVNASHYKGQTGPTAAQFSYLDATSSIQTQLNAKQASSAVLTTYAGIAPSANVQTMLGSADNAAIRSNIGAQAYDADLTTYAGITPSANVQTMLGSANNETIRSNIGLAIGTNVQAYDADLTTYAGITPSADIQTLLGSANASTARTNLGLAIGSNVQAYDAGLQSLAGVTETAGGMLYSTASNTFANLAIGSAGKILRSNGSAPTWATLIVPDTAAAGSVLAANSANTLTAVNSTSGTTYLKNVDGTISWAAITGGGDLKADGTVPLTADWNAGAYTITAGKFATAKSSGVAGAMSLFEANSTDTNVVGFMGPSNVTSSWLYQFNSTAPSAGQVMAFGVPSGSGGPDGEAVSAQTWVVPALSSSYANQVTLNAITSGGILYGSAANTVGSTDAGTTGQVLKAVTSSAPVWGMAVVDAGTSPTISAAGNIGIDTTSDQLKYYGSAARVLPYKKTFSVVVPSVADTDDLVVMKAPYGMTLTAIDCVVSASTSATINIQECDANGANCSDTATSDLTCATTNTNTTSFSNATIDSGDWLKLDVASINGTPGNLSVTVTYSVVGD